MAAPSPRSVQVPGASELPGASAAPNPFELAVLVGLNAKVPLTAEPLPARHGHAIWRIGTPGRSYVLKWLPEGAAATELKAYRLLTELGVPTLPLYGLGGQALLLEDLAASETWRLAEEADSERPEVGSALARWYHSLHDRGARARAETGRPALLDREIDRLDADGVLALWAVFGLADESDVRNVTSSLAGEAVSAFETAYGDLDPREAVLDAPLSTLFDLHVAARHPLARWAEGSLARVAAGRFEHELRTAIELCDAEGWG